MESVKAKVISAMAGHYYSTVSGRERAVRKIAHYMNK